MLTNNLIALGFSVTFGVKNHAERDRLLKRQADSSDQRLHNLTMYVGKPIVPPRQVKCQPLVVES
jgi:hypothetical protein